MKKVNNNYIYTPVSLWNDFSVNASFQESFISELTNDGIVFKSVYFYGRQLESERVRIFANLACPINGNGATIVLVDEPNKPSNMETVSFFAKMGYSVIAPQLMGETDGEENFTRYPELISYANYEQVKDKLFNVEQTAKETCWYEWASVVRCTIAFAKYSFNTDKIGLVGIKNGSNVCFMSCTEDVKSFVSIFGAGWQTFKDEDRLFESESLSDQQRKFIAGIEAESYAPYIKCPVLFLSTTNSREFNFERAVDTLARFPKEPYCDFTPKMRYYLDENSLEEFKLFFQKTLLEEDVKLYKSPEVSVSAKVDLITVDAVFDAKEDILSCEMYYSNASVDVYKRNWNIFSDEICDTYLISSKYLSEYVSVFVRVKYKNGVCVSSPVVVKKIGLGTQKIANPIFSGKKNENTFVCRMPSKVSAGLFFNTNEEGVSIVEGPFSIKGAFCKSGLINYKIGEVSSLLTSNEIIKFDIYSERYNDLTVSLLVEEDEVKEYKINVNIKGAKIWQNICESIAEFKNELGKSIKDFSSVFALAVYSEEEFLITNLLII